MKTINGFDYRTMLQYGVRHLDKHRTAVNDLNVFPVPDGDTGTNMVMTLKNGICSITQQAESLAKTAHAFANATVFGARGNSGVIVSQFFKGISEGLRDCAEADCAAFSKALDAGCEYAYSSVAKPVEGTILTVIREATDAVRAHVEELQSIDELIDLFLREAKRSLDRTPQLLPILKKAGVVDSGGAGLVYFFEGIRRYLNGDAPDDAEEEMHGDTQYVDFGAFNKNSNFEYGYCTEALLQLTVDEEAFDYEAFVQGLQSLGDSLVTSLEGDKVKLHVHTRFPERVLAFCHPYGEFLTLKIENMSVQHTQQSTQKILCSEVDPSSHFAVVAVAPNAMLQGMLLEMGADVVIMSEEAPSSEEFLEAFTCVSTKEILVFPNSSNSILSAMQAGGLYKNAKITVLNCRSIPECYAALAILDFESDDTDRTVADVNETIRNLYEVSVVHATKNIAYGGKTVIKNDYFALSGEEILFSADRFEDVVKQTVQQTLRERDCGVVTLFYGRNVTQERIEALAQTLEQNGCDAEICIHPTQNAIYDLVLSFE